MSSAVRWWLRPGVLAVAAINLGVGLVLAVMLWWARAGSEATSFFSELTSSLLHSAVYGLSFGAAMPLLAGRGQRWRWLWVLAGLVVVSAAATAVIQLGLARLGHLDPDE